MIDTLTSDRLLLTPLSTTHCSEDYVSWMNNAEVYRYLESGGNYTINELDEYLRSVEKSPNILFWAIHLKESNKHIGNIKIDPVNKRHNLGEYGILMGDMNEWGKGYAKEASLLVINHCFSNLNIRKITLGVVQNNIAAVKLYNSLGFEVEGVYKNHGLYHGEYLDVLRMALFNPSYEY